jgi:hypothetical protein
LRIVAGSLKSPRKANLSGRNRCVTVVDAISASIG